MTWIKLFSVGYHFTAMYTMRRQVRLMQFFVAVAIAAVYGVFGREVLRKTAGGCPSAALMARLLCSS